MNMITSNIPSPSGSTLTTATSHNDFSSFSNQPLSHYPIPPNLSPYNPFPPYFLPVQQLVLPPSYPQAYQSSYSYMLQQWNDPTCAHTPSDFLSPPPNPVHLNQQYSFNTNTPILHVHQNPSLSNEQHPLPSFPGCPPQPQLDHSYHPLNLALHYRQQPFYTNTLPNPSPKCHYPLPPLTDGPPPPQRPRLDTSHFTSFTPTSTTVAYHSLAPPTPATTILPPQLNATATSQVTSYTSPSLTSASQESSSTSHSPLSHHLSPGYTSAPLPTTAISTSVAIHSTAPPSPSARPITLSAGTASSYQHSLSPNMQRYMTYLKNFYKQKKTPVYDKEATLLHFKCKSFINIALVHKNSKVSTDSEKKEMLMDRLHGHVDVIQNKKTKLRMCDVCKSQDGTLAHSVLVEGAPGVGKTTFAFQLCKQWAKEEILHEWAVVVVIKLRDKTIRNAQAMYDLLYHPDPEVRQTVVKELVHQDGKGMLLILDGYDELTDSQRDDNSIVQHIMSRQLLCCATLMVTSRPLATRTLHDNFVHSIDQHIEVLGFTEKNIVEYIQSACGDKPELMKDFKSYLSCHPFSSALMFNPLQCAIVTDLYRSHWERGDKGFAPKTLTELYTGLVCIILVRYLTHYPVYKHRDWKIKDLSDLPEEVSQQLTVVTKLAAKGIENQQYVFDDVDGNVPSETLGLMQREEDVTAGMGKSASHSFLHLTLQEYLTAVYYCTDKQLPTSELLERNGLFPLKSFLDMYGKKRKQSLSSSATHWPVVLFLAGRTKLSDVSPDTLKKGLHNPKTDSDVTEVNVSLLHLLYETQSPQLIKSTLVASRKYLSVSGSSALDWFVIGYCIANSTGIWKLEKRAGDKHNYLDRLILGLNLASEEIVGQRSKIHSLVINGYCTATVQSLSQIQTCYTESMTELKLLNSKQERGVRVIIDVSTQYPNLEVLEIKVNNFLNKVTISSLNKQNNLHTLSLSRCYLSIDDCRSLILSMQSPHCKLHKLILNNCQILKSDQTQHTTIHKATQESLNITGPLSVLDQMIPAIHPFTQLTELKLHIETVDCGVDMEILDNIHSCCPLLNTLILRVDGDSSFSLPFSFPQFLGSQHNNLHTLSLSGCVFSSNITKSLIHSLQSPHSRLFKLTIHRCTMPTPEETQQTTIATEDNGTLHSLDITDSLCVVDQIMSHVIFTQLTELICSVTQQYSLETMVFQKIFSSCPALNTVKCTASIPLSICQFIGSQQNNLHTLSLDECNLSSGFTRSFIHSLQSPYCKLYKLALYGCTIPTTDHTQLTTAIVSSTTITHLLFIDESIDAPASLTALASGLKHNTTIEQLAVDRIGKLKKDQFQMLIDAVDSSAVEKLCLCGFSDYKKLFSDCTLSRKNVDIEWYNGYFDLYNKW